MYRFDSTYKVKVNDDLGSATFWNNRFQDIDLRINFTENYAETINSAVEELVVRGLAQVNAAINPGLSTLNAQLVTLTNNVTALENLVIADQTDVVDQLNALLVTAQTLVAAMQGLGTISDGTF